MDNSWQPGAEFSALQQRAVLIAQIRSFFAERGVLEVETPLLSRVAATDLHLDSFIVEPHNDSEKRYLQTSPESAMKRLLAAHGQPIYQLCKAFRADEYGSRHNPEFSMLEWYRPGFSIEELGREVADLIASVTGITTVKWTDYRQLFMQQLQVDPWQCSVDELASVAADKLSTRIEDTDVNTWLDLLFSHLVEPQLGEDCQQFIYGYPPDLAAQSRITRDSENRPIAERFEVFVGGIELANGYYELIDAKELRSRMTSDICSRRDRDKTPVPEDERLIAALEHGLPECAGVALGVDRLIMIALGAARVSEVISFDWPRS